MNFSLLPNNKILFLFSSVLCVVERRKTLPWSITMISSSAMVKRDSDLDIFKNLPMLPEAHSAHTGMLSVPSMTGKFRQSRLPDISLVSATTIVASLRSLKLCGFPYKFI